MVECLWFLLILYVLNACLGTHLRARSSWKVIDMGFQ